MNDYGAFNIEGDGAVFKNVTPIQDQWEPAVIQGSLGASYRLNNLFSVYFNSTAGQIKPLEGSLTTDLTEPRMKLRYKFDLGIVRYLSGTGKITATLSMYFRTMQLSSAEKHILIQLQISGGNYILTVTRISMDLNLN